MSVVMKLNKVPRVTFVSREGNGSSYSCLLTDLIWWCWNFQLSFVFFDG